jgi:hypothetical protein
MKVAEEQKKRESAAAMAIYYICIFFLLSSLAFAHFEGMMGIYSVSWLKVKLS